MHRSGSIACLLGLAAACSGDGAPARDKPPVVVIVVDALHALHVSHLGYPRETTPNLDDLAAEGVTFTQAFAPAPFTLASIPSLLTGRLPDSHGVSSNSRRLGEQEVTLAEHLSRAGYRTFGAVANLNGGSVYGNDQGFDEFVELFRADGERSADGVWEGGGVHIPRADEFLPVIERWCAEDLGGAPSLFYLHLLEPHEPYVPPDQFKRRFLSSGYEGEFKDGLTVELTLEHVARFGELHAPGKEEKDALVALYDGNVAWVDRVLGEVFERLKSAGIYDEALIVVTSDHGEAFWQHGRRGHGGFLFDEELRVPLVVKFPAGRGPVGARVDRLASLVDVLPSICAWLDLPLPARSLDGLSLDELMHSDADAPDERELILRSYRPKFLAAVRTRETKTILRYDAETHAIKGVQHYDLASDGLELEDLYSDRASDLTATVARLQAWVKGAAGGPAGKARTRTGEERALLEALGYTY